MDVREDLIYGVSWSPRPKRSIFKVKRALKLLNPIHSRFSCAISLPSFLVIQNFKIIFTKNMHGHPLICYLWIWFFITVKMTYYQGQMSPRAGNPLFCRFSCVIVYHLFWRSKIPTSFLSKYFMDVC